MTERKKRIKDSNNRRSQAVYRLYRNTEKSYETALSVRSSNPTPETYAVVDKVKAARDLVQYVKHHEEMPVPTTWQEFFDGDETKPEYPYTFITRLDQEAIDDDIAERKAKTKERIAAKIAEGLALIGIKN